MQINILPDGVTENFGRDRFYIEADKVSNLALIDKTTLMNGDKAFCIETNDLYIFINGAWKKVGGSNV